MKKLLMGLLGMVLAGSAAAQMPPPPRSIVVTGEASQDFVPDQAVLSIALVAKDKNLHTAKQHNDAMVEQLVAITQKLDIPKEKVSTSNVAIAPEYSYANNEQHFNDYVVSRSIRVTMTNLDMPEKLLSALVDAKIDQVNGLEYRLADPEAHGVALRDKAFANAKAKAEALAQAAGSKLGKALEISTDGGGMPRPPRPMPMMAAAARAEASVAPSLPGMIELRESVSVTFELE
jgi:uncharacterized protein YggE